MADFTRSLPARGVWIEIKVVFATPQYRSESLPARGVWIEMSSSGSAGGGVSVAPRKGSVD